ncbi:hypothetical protein PPERSA_11784 [Pseudocohnilembus persalinus]|uniref:Uncharacterized protein n=1 Tax=Pseudocohnilembus persalinus TaxID=266149 RepID=A0A0V0QGL0_PSEPJ|nr:hypothetical protein PPERSA_11784 [Pseudocohnilembus persalinus]|eukprot:KRX01337.1 hypothetical protein PPERSA_11784 [Pseudocohnilembus persalinus]
MQQQELSVEKIEVKQPQDLEKTNKDKFKNIKVIEDEYGFCLLEGIHVDNQKKKGFTVEEHECWGYEGFKESCQFILKGKKNLIADWQPGPSKIHVKKMNQVNFTPDSIRATIFNARIIYRFENGLTLFCIENVLFKNREKTSSKGTIDVKEFNKAVKEYIAQVNMTLDPKVVAVYSEPAGRLVWKNLQDCETDNLQGCHTFILGKEIKLGQ